MNAPSDNDRAESIIAECREALESGDTSTVVRLLGEHPELSHRLLPLLQGSGSTAIPSAESTDMGSTVVRQSDSSADHGTMAWQGDSDVGSSMPTDATLTHLPGSSRGSGSDLPFRNSPALGSMIGGFRLLRPLGRGGMGEVFEAEEVVTGRRLALKMLSSNVPRNSQTVERFMNEASLAASLTHPRTTFVYGAGEQDGKFYISMELMPGQTLKDLVEKGGPRPVDEAIDHVVDMLDGLEAAHQSGVIHRDLKPSNCFVDAGDRIKIGDFGLAKSLVDGADITQTGMFLGTPQFAAPEQIRHADVDQRTDLFSVGATLYYLLTGTPPYTGDPAAVIAQIVADPPPKVRGLRPEVPKTIEGIITRCMSKNPKRRYSSAGELRRALLPFSSRGTSMTDVGRRMAAMFIDLVFAVVVTALVYLALRVFNNYLKSQDAGYVIKPVLEFFGSAALISVPYFAFCEWWWGCTPAKKWLGIRVVDTYGESPRFWRSLLRAAILPGLFLSSVDVARSFYLQSETVMQAVEGLIPNGTLRGWLESEIFLLVKALLALVCCSTMRRSNGYRGLHGIISGTRIVRTADKRTQDFYRWLGTLAEPAKQVQGLPAKLGPYRVLGHFCSRMRFQILEGYDEELSRKVWLYLSPHQAEQITADRAAVPRATRQRWLQHGVDGESQWLAIEAVDGGPVTGLISQDGGLPWAVGRTLLADLAEELLASLEDGTLPPSLSLGQIWLDQRGGLRLLDFPMSAEVEVVGDIDGDGTDVERAWDLFCDVMRRCRIDMSTPGEAQDYLGALLTRKGGKDLLRAAALRFREIEDVPFELGWDNRLAMLAVTLCVDLIVINTWCFFCSWVAATLCNYRMALALCVAIPLGLLLPFALGFFCKGGLAFWLSGFQTRVLKTRRKSQVRSAIRSMLGWSTIVIPQIIVRVSFYLIAMLNESNDGANSVFEDKEALIVGMVFVALPAVFLGGLALLGGAVSILWPRRGLQDRVVGTYVVHQ